MEPEGSLPHSQASTTCLYPGPAQSNPLSYYGSYRERTHSWISGDHQRTVKEEFLNILMFRHNP